MWLVTCLRVWVRYSFKTTMTYSVQDNTKMKEFIVNQLHFIACYIFLEQTNTLLLLMMRWWLFHKKVCFSQLVLSYHSFFCSTMKNHLKQTGFNFPDFCFLLNDMKSCRFLRFNSRWHFSSYSYPHYIMIYLTDQTHQKSVGRDTWYITLY